MNKNIGILLSGGTGARFGADTPKQYLPLLNRMVIEYSIDAFRQSAAINTLLVMASEKYIPLVSSLLRPGEIALTGGATRNASIKNALEHIAAHHPDCQKILITDAARPFLTGTVIDRYIAALDESDAVLSVRKITDSLGSHSQWVVDRDMYYLYGAPEAFHFRQLYNCFRADSQITGTAQQLPPGSRLHLDYEFTENMKITYPHDLGMAEYLMRYRVQGAREFNRSRT